MFHRFGLLAAAAMFVTGHVHAEPLAPIQGKSVDLGTLTGIVYYTVEAEGFCVVATLQVGETQTPVRFAATLAPEQSVTLSTPRGAGEPAIDVRFVRHGEQMFVERDGLVADATQVADVPATR